MDRSGRVPPLEWIIVAQAHRFVNLVPACSLFRRLAFLIGFLVFCYAPAQSQDENPTSELYQQALDKLGPESRIQWAEPGDLSLNRWEPGRSIELRGVLIEWEADRLVLVRKGDAGPTTFPGDNVVGIEPGWKEESFSEVHRHFLEHRFADVLRQGQAVLKTPSIPRWQQRLIVAEMVQSACALRQSQVAGKLYGYLVQDRGPQLLMSVIPLPWSDELLNSGRGMSELALTWIQNQEPEMQLLGASWLLGGEQNGMGTDRLKRLSDDNSLLVSNYAKVQLWRTVPPSEIESQHLGKWVALRDRMPLSLQAGPTMLLGHRLDQAGAWELAVAEWLRIASFHADRYYLGVRAIDRATAACRNADARDWADRIIARYPHLAGSNR